MNQGAKAENLKLLQEGGFPVPPFFVLSAEEVSSILIDKSQNAFHKQFDEWLNANNVSKIAVRSSADVEDSPRYSYAGQFKTVLNVSSFEDVLVALKDISQSGGHTGYGKQSAKINIIIQKMLFPDRAGVIFTQDPTGLSDCVVINSNFGLGDTVVAGEACDQYFIERSTKKFHSKIAHSKKIHLANEEQITDKPSLDKLHINNLTNIALRIERFFGTPQDIEWGIVCDDIYIIQSRPITRLEKVRIWDSSNIAESYPGITLPLTISIARRAYVFVYKSQARLSGIPWHEIEENQRLLESMIGSFQGRLYYNLDSWYQYMSLFPNASINQEFFDKMIQTSGQEIYRPPKARSRLFRAQYFIRTLWRVLFFNKEVRNFYRRVDFHFQALGRLGFSTDADFILNRYLSLESNLLPYWGTTVDNDFLAMLYNGFLNRLWNRWLYGQSEQFKSQLIAGVKNVESVEQAVALQNLADQLRNNQQLSSLIYNGKFSLAWQEIEKSELRQSFEEYIDRFGNRFALDLKLEVENTLSSPEGLLTILRAYIELPPEELISNINTGVQRAIKMERTILQLLPFYKRSLFHFVLHRLKTYIRNREKMRLLRSKVFQIARTTFQELGTILHDQNDLDSASDIYYAEIDELVQFVNGSLAIDVLKPLIKARKAEYSNYLHAKQPPDRFVTQGLPKNKLIPRPPAGLKSDLRGMVCSIGSVAGKATVMLEPVIPKTPLEILVVRHTDPGWTPIIALSKGVIVEKGGLLSHAAIITRELGIPCIIGVTDACEIIKNGDSVLLDATSGTITIEKK
jgi:pyruvate,water dikinase